MVINAKARYHKRSLSAPAMFGYKQLIKGKLSLRNYKRQVGKNSIVFMGTQQDKKSSYA
jgi:hypothetical protein